MFLRIIFLLWSFSRIIVCFPKVPWSIQVWFFASLTISSIGSILFSKIVVGYSSNIYATSASEGVSCEPVIIIACLICYWVKLMKTLSSISFFSESFFPFVYSFETKPLTYASLELTMYLIMTSLWNLWFSFWQTLSSGITGIWNHTQFVQCWKWKHNFEAARQTPEELVFISVCK